MWRATEATAKEIEFQEGRLPDQVEERLGKDPSDQQLFSVRLEIV